jgi:hypothetical protein
VPDVPESVEEVDFASESARLWRYVATAAVVSTGRPGSDLTKEHRRTHREADSDRDPGENRPEPQERHGRPEPIEGNLGRSADAGATPT